MIKSTKSILILLTIIALMISCNNGKSDENYVCKTEYTEYEMFCMFNDCECKVSDEINDCRNGDKCFYTISQYTHGKVIEKYSYSCIQSDCQVNYEVDGHLASHYVDDNGNCVRRYY